MSCVRRTKHTFVFILLLLFLLQYHLFERLNSWLLLCTNDPLNRLIQLDSPNTTSLVVDSGGCGPHLPLLFCERFLLLGEIRYLFLIVNILLLHVTVSSWAVIIWSRRGRVVLLTLELVQETLRGLLLLLLSCPLFRISRMDTCE